MAFIKERSTRNSNWKAQERRRAAASIRKMLYDKLTAKEKIALLDKGEFKAKKQRAKLKHLED